MPVQISSLTAAVQAALQAWQGRRLTLLIRLAREVTDETDLDEFARAKVGELLADTLSQGVTWLVLKLVEWGEDIDDRLDNVWDRLIKDPEVRAKVEQHDNPALVFFKALDSLLDAIRSAAAEVQSSSPEEVAQRIVLARLGGGPAGRPFVPAARRGLRLDRRRVAVLRGASVAELRQQLDAALAEQQQLQQSSAEQDARLQQQEARIAELQDRLAAAEQAAGDDSADADADTPPVDDEPIASEEEGGADPLASPGADGPITLDADTLELVAGPAEPSAEAGLDPDAAQEDTPPEDGEEPSLGAAEMDLPVVDAPIPPPVSRFAVESDTHQPSRRNRRR